MVALQSSIVIMLLNIQIDDRKQRLEQQMEQIQYSLEVFRDASLLYSKTDLDFILSYPYVMANVKTRDIGLHRPAVQKKSPSSLQTLRMLSHN